MFLAQIAYLSLALCLAGLLYRVARWRPARQRAKDR